MNANVSEAVANVQEAVAEQVSEVRAEALEDAATRVEAAERAAREVADAALQTELGRRVQTVETELGQCRTEISSLQNRISELAAAPAPAPTVIMDNSSIQQPRSLPPADQLPPAQLPPENADADGPEKTAAQTPARKRRLL